MLVFIILLCRVAAVVTGWLCVGKGSGEGLRANFAIAGTIERGDFDNVTTFPFPLRWMRPIVPASLRTRDGFFTVLSVPKCWADLLEWCAISPCL